MRLLRDLWTTSPRRTAVVACLIILGAAGQAGASALAGSVLVGRSSSLFVLLAAALVVAVLSDVSVGLIMSRLTADWTAAVRRGLCKMALGQDLPTLETTPVGELLDRIDSDVYQVGADLRGSGIRIAQSTAFAVLSVITALIVWWPAGVAMLVLSTVLVLTLRRRFADIGPKRVAEEEAWSDLAAVMEESIHGQDDIRTSLARPYVMKLFARRASEVLSRGRLVWRMSARLTTIASGVMRFGIALVVVGGAWALVTGRVDSARLTAIWLLTLAFAGTAEHLSRLVPELQNALGAWSRVQQLRDSAQEPEGGVAPAEGDVTIRGLTFGYPVRAGETAPPASASGERSESARERGSNAPRPPVLRDVSLAFLRGRSYAVIGRTGSGKSTLAKVLTRSVDVPRGAVFLGGTDLVDLDLEALRRWVAIVPQRTEILAGTVAENVALFDADLLAPAARAMSELGLQSWIADLPDGMETKLGDGGHVLSAGQEQLVAFARILVRDPHIVILDEATARMDPVTERRVQRATERLLRDRIGIVIAHRLSSLRRCDDVVVLADGEVVEAGPLGGSERFARLLATSEAARGPSASEHRRITTKDDGASGDLGLMGANTITRFTDPPPLPPPAPVRTFREIIQLTLNEPRYGVAAVGIFMLMVLFGLDGSVLPWLWADLVDGVGDPLWPVVGIVAALVFLLPAPYYTGVWFAEWWVRQMLRISNRLVYGQTGPRRVSAHTPAEVVAQAGDTERVVALADNVIDQSVALFVLVTMTIVSGSFVPALFFAATMLVSGAVATIFGPVLERSGRRTVGARAAFATALVSALSAARTVKLAGATRPVLAHLSRLDQVRSERQRNEISIQVLARSTPSIVSGLLPVAVWAFYLAGGLSAGATLVAVSTLGAARWFAWTTASLVSQLPSARVWTRRTVAMTGVSSYAAVVPGVDISAGTAPGPPATPRHPLRTLALISFTAVHEDGTVGANDIHLTIHRGQLVLVVGPVGSGKSSLLRAMAGIVHHTGTLHWNGQPVTEPEVFLRPNQVGYVGQLPRVLSGTLADNIQLGQEVDVDSALATAQMEHDLAATGGGHGLLIGHKGIRLSGGQLQRLALARALAPGTELLIADDVSSALDVTTELDLWRALRERGVTVVGSTSKRAALAHADQVVVLIGGAAVAHGTWTELSARWGHLAG
jgi:ABC-type multidrug transport system fused ATPase/permease subunit